MDIVRAMQSNTEPHILRILSPTRRSLIRKDTHVICRRCKKMNLCQYESSSDADVAMKIEASCLLRMGGSIILGMKGAVGIRLATANNAVARRLLGILKKQYELPTKCISTTRLKLA